MNSVTNKTTILVVDDNEANLYAVSRTLRTAGFNVLEAATGTQALEMANRKPDLVILDVLLPDISGVEVCKRLKESPETSSTIIVHLSANFVSPEDRARGLEEGADGYLVHPIDPIVLVATVNAYVRLREAETALKGANTELQARIEASTAALAQLELERELREQFVSMLSHDLRNPLAAANISAQMLLRGTESRHQQSLALRIMSSVGRADKMIQDLLDVNRIRAGQRLPLNIVECDMRKIAEAAVEDMGSSHGDRFILIGDQEIRGFWSPDAIRRVLENLMSNALKYGDPQEKIVVAATKQGRKVRLAVHNKGDAIPPAEQATLFDVFRRAHSAQSSGKRGWGLGLALVRGISDAHFGQVSVESMPNKGTTFIIDMPLDARQSEADNVSTG